MDDGSPSLDIVTAADGLCSLNGRVYRAVFEHDRAHVLAGSDRPGRFTPPGCRTLYTSTTAQGTLVALGPYMRTVDPPRTVVALDVQAQGICDLRDRAACAALGFDATLAAVPWHEAPPPSWTIVEMLIARGANGVIDPSRKRPDLFHLALFRWNEPGAPTVTLAE